jgi:hypothetical protein
LDYQQLVAEFKAIKDGKSIHRKMCKWGDDCKYKYKCRFTHPSDIEKEEESKKAADPKQLSKYALHMKIEINRIQIESFSLALSVRFRQFGSSDDNFSMNEDQMRDAVRSGLKRTESVSDSAISSKRQKLLANEVLPSTELAVVYQSKKWFFLFIFYFLHSMRLID